MRGGILLLAVWAVTSVTGCAYFRDYTVPLFALERQKVEEHLGLKVDKATLADSASHDKIVEDLSTVLGTRVKDVQVDDAGLAWATIEAPAVQAAKKAADAFLEKGSKAENWKELGLAVVGSLTLAWGTFRGGTALMGRRPARPPGTGPPGGPNPVPAPAIPALSTT